MCLAHDKCSITVSYYDFFFILLQIQLKKVNDSFHCAIEGMEKMEG